MQHGLSYASIISSIPLETLFNSISSPDPVIDYIVKSLKSNRKNKYRYIKHLPIAYILNCIHSGVILKGGTRPNIIPEETQLHYYLRAPTVGQLNKLTEKVKGCFEAAAVATGCSVIFFFFCIFWCLLLCSLI